jgi:8-oxo-dGTP diphosphatase
MPPEDLVWNFCPICGAKLLPAHDGESHRPHCLVCRRFFYHNPVPAACGFVRRDDGALLLVQRGVEPCKGQWSLPGGFMEVDESPEECILRELREETGLLAAHAHLIGAKTKPSALYGSVLVLGFFIDGWSGDLQAGSDCLDVQFFPFDARPDLAFTVHREFLEIYDSVYA